MYPGHLKIRADTLCSSRLQQRVESAQKFAAQHEGVTLAIEPYSNSKTKLFSNNIKLVDMEDGLKENGIHVLLVEHREFIGQRPDSKYILDFKGIWTND